MTATAPAAASLPSPSGRGAGGEGMRTSAPFYEVGPTPGDAIDVSPPPLEYGAAAAPLRNPRAFQRKPKSHWPLFAALSATCVVLILGIVAAWVASQRSHGEQAATGAAADGRGEGSRRNERFIGEGKPRGSGEMPAKLIDQSAANSGIAKATEPERSPEERLNAERGRLSAWCRIQKGPAYATLERPPLPRRGALPVRL